MIVFFDLFDYVLTDFEIWRLLSVKCELSQVVEMLENLEKFPQTSPGPLLGKERELVENKNGFYFLAGREENIRVRLSRYNFTDRKFKRALLIARLLKFIPWVKLIAVVNLYGAHNLKDDSDIDLFIITEKNRLWISRWFCVGLIKLLRLRPDLAKGIYRDKICLSFFISQAALDLDQVRLEDDICFAYWLAGLTSIYDAGGVYQELIKANRWLGISLPNWQPINPVRRRQVKPFLSEFYHDLADLFIGGLEPQVKALQLKLLPPPLKNIMNQDRRVAVNDQIIKLHANDRRSEYRERYYRKIYETYRKNN